MAENLFFVLFCFVLFFHEGFIFYEHEVVIAVMRWAPNNVRELNDEKGFQCALDARIMTSTLTEKNNN